ncbi:MAG: BRCT domain-containing protein [Acidobacteriia bacterium]|nr:BRCT domain-containing protein [Terriglobia bacterium]
MSAPLDGNGQPISLGLNRTGRINRAINEINGFLRGVLADNYISADECEQLAKWVMGNREVSDIWPVSVLVERLNCIYQDGVADEEERADLANLADEIIGKQDDETFEFVPTDLPLTKPLPDIIFADREFVFTGAFFCGTRKTCKRDVELRGAHCTDSIRLTTNYLVIGSLMSRDWKFTTHGTKIQKAVEYQRRCPIAIVAERHWQSAISKTAAR